MSERVGATIDAMRHFDQHGPEYDDWWLGYGVVRGARATRTDGSVSSKAWPLARVTVAQSSPRTLIPQVSR